MSRGNEQTLKEAIQELIKTYRLDDKINEVKLFNSWETILGKSIAKHTKAISIKNGILYVTLDSSVLRQELSYAKEKMIKLLNESVGTEVIKDIVLR